MNKSQNNLPNITPVCYEVEKTGTFKLFESSSVDHHWIFIINSKTHDLILTEQRLMGKKTLKLNGEIINQSQNILKKGGTKFEFWVDKLFFQLVSKGEEEYDIIVDKTPFSMLLN